MGCNIISLRQMVGGVVSHGALCIYPFGLDGGGAQDAGMTV
jgi:hypothetical protein